MAAHLILAEALCVCEMGLIKFDYLKCYKDFSFEIK